MSFGELFKTNRWKTTMGFVYGWGASIVMLGALFKLQHWQYGGLLLTIGLLTEAVIFFLSAFEPPYISYEWSKVYPELSEGMEGLEFEEKNLQGRSEGVNPLLATTNLSPELIDRVNASLTNLSSAAEGIRDISSATLATDNYMKNMHSAAESMSAFTTVNQRANQTVNQAVEKLASSYSSASEQISDSGKSAIEKLNRSSEEFAARLSDTGNKLANTFNNTSGSVSNEIKNIEDGSKMYSGNLEKLNQNLNALNQSFESQLMGTQAQQEASRKFNNDLMQMNEILASSVSELQKYKNNAEQLNKHLESLNTIYGNMLSALSYRK